MLYRLRFYLAHSLNDLRANLRRTAYALLCIAAGVAAIVSLQTVGLMIEDTLTGGLQELLRGDIRLTTGGFGGLSSNERRAYEADGIILLEEQNRPFGGTRTIASFTFAGIETLRQWFIAETGGDVAITYRLRPPTDSFFGFGTSISAPEVGTSTSFITPYIVEKDRYPLYGEARAEDGQRLADLLQAPNDIVISRNLADALRVQVGDMLRFAGARQDFVLRGIVPVHTEGGFDNFTGILFGYAYLDVGAVDLFEDLQPRAERLFVRLSDPTQVERLDSAVRAAFPYLRAYTTVELRETNATFSDLFSDMVGVLGLIGLLIGGIGIVNTMQVIVRRRTMEVAVLKTLGLDGDQITLLFLVEAFLMGLLGSLIGIVTGWIITFVLKGVAESFVAVGLSFRIAPGPAISGLVTGVLVATVFGFLPTLSAGQIRPALVLRPRDSIVPQGGALRSFVALVFTILALSLIAQPLSGSLLLPPEEGGDFLRMGPSFVEEFPAREVAGVIGAALGLLMAGGSLAGGFFAGRVGRSRLLRLAHPLLLLAGLPLLGAWFGAQIPALLIVVGVFAVGAGLFVLLWALIWLIGRLMPSFGLVDLKLSLRAMLNQRARGAVTLLALAVSVFGLSLIVLMVSTINQTFAQLSELQAGGNVFVFTAGFGVGDASGSMQRAIGVLDGLDGVRSYAVIESYDLDFASFEDAGTGEVMGRGEVRARMQANGAPQSRADNFEDALRLVDGRDVTSNLPVLDFVDGRQLTPEDAGQPVLVLQNTLTVQSIGVQVGDRITYRVDGQPVTFTVVGLTVEGLNLDVGASAAYAPREVFAGAAPLITRAVVDMDELQIPELRRRLGNALGTFVIETRLINTLIDTVLNQFTAFPVVVGLLGMAVGGIVIANSVALATLERRKEIAIMKAVGLQRRRVLGMLLIENGLLGLVGGLIGVGLGSLILALFLATVPANDFVSFDVSYGVAFLLMAACIVIAMLAALLTAWGASGERPLNVLRYE